MRSNDLDHELRRYEALTTYQVPLGELMVARLDGRGFTRLTKELLDFESPFDPRFHDAMVVTTRHLMKCGFRVRYAVTHSDEISLLFHPRDTTFDRQVSKYNSVLAAEASATFSLEIGRAAAFDCRISQLPSQQKVVDYFRWRQEDSRRNSLNAHCYWELRKSGKSGRQADKELCAKSRKEKLRLLRENGVIFEELPAWKRAGVGLFWEKYMKEGHDPRTQTSTMTERWRIKVETELPEGGAYGEMIRGFVEQE